MFAESMSLGQMFSVNKSFNACKFCAKYLKTTSIHAENQYNDVLWLFWRAIAFKGKHFVTNRKVFFFFQPLELMDSNELSNPENRCDESFRVKVFGSGFFSSLLSSNIVLSVRNNVGAVFVESVKGVRRK